MPDHDPVRLKRLYFRSRHRGTKELDALLGRFAERYLGSLTAAELDQYEALLAESDPDLFNWITGSMPPPSAYDTGVLARLAEVYLGSDGQ